jgi:hypothetical protein
MKSYKEYASAKSAGRFSLERPGFSNCGPIRSQGSAIIGSTFAARRAGK